jgi:tRNA pseudouridine38-40 synthase
MDERNIKLILSYDGTDYSGFQSQKNARTIEDELKCSLKKIAEHEISIHCAGRTDAGVHAEEQTVNFHTTRTGMKEINWIKALNSILPRDIRVMNCEFVNDDFHARRSAIYREYWYNIINSQTISALSVRFAARFPYFSINPGLLQSYGSILLGENDFSSFCASGDVCESKYRYIHSIRVEKETDFVTIKIIANAFLQHMVRIIIGTMLLLHKTDEKPEKMKNILLSKNRSLAGPTYIPDGLVFKKVYYDESILKKQYTVPERFK